MQEAYALCRVSKKTATGPKILEPTNQMACERSSSIELYSDQGRYCEDFETSSYPIHKIDHTCPSTSYASTTGSGFPLDVAESRDGRWTQFCDAFSYSSTPSFANNYGTIPYPPSKVTLDTCSSLLFIVSHNLNQHACVYI